PARSRRGPPTPRPAPWRNAPPVSLRPGRAPHPVPPPGSVATFRRRARATSGQSHGWHEVRLTGRAAGRGGETVMTGTASPEPTTEQDILIGLHPSPRPGVILVEDDPEMRLFLSEMLEEEGYEVRAAADSLSGLCLQLRQPADVVVTDWKMPDMDGLKLLQA